MNRKLRTLIIHCVLIFLLNIFDVSEAASNKNVFYYCYYEKNAEYKKNFDYFLKNALLDNVDYYIIINGNCDVPIPGKNNLFIIQRENIGFDFGAYSYVIQNFDVSNYEYYFFCNTSVRGPFLSSENHYKDWTEPFLSLLKNDVKLVGTTINVLSGNYFQYLNQKYFHSNRNVLPHVQSMMFVMDRECFNFLNNIKFFDYDRVCKLSFEEIIAFQEINLSTLVLQNGWNINCIASMYQGIDYRVVESDFNPTSHSGDPVFPGAYFGRTIDPFEVIFFKTNRLPIKN